MNSIIRQSHIKASDLHDYARSYDSSNTTAVSIWAKSACVGLEPGAIVFLIEPVTLPFGLITFVRKDEEENCRVIDLAVIVRIEDGKAMAVAISNNAYELRFLESLLEERARKAIIDRKKFSFVAAKLAAPLPLTKFQELERLSNLYAKGGLRKTYMSTNPQEEPAIALLAACGAHITHTSLNKQPVDIGSICYSLFSSEAKHTDGNRSQLKSAFVPMPGDLNSNPQSFSPPVDFDLGIAKAAQPLLDTPASSKSGETSQRDNSGFSLLNSWGGSDQNKSSTDGASLLDHLTAELPKGQKFWQEENEISPVNEIPPAQKEEKQIPGNELPQQPQDNNVFKPEIIPDEDVYKHLSDAITDLLGNQTQPQPQKGKVGNPKNVPTKNYSSSEPPSPGKVRAARSFEKLPAFVNSLNPQVSVLNTPINLNSPPQNSASSLNLPTSSAPTSAPVIEEPATTPNIDISTPATTAEPAKEEVIGEYPAVTANEPVSFLEEDNSAVEQEDNPIQTGDQATIFAAAEMMPSKLDDFQEPKVVINEMASLMSKLESQVARAAKKLAATASAIEKRLAENLDNLLAEVNQEDKDAYAELVVKSDLLAKRFEQLFDSLRTELAEKSASSREQIKAKISEYQNKISASESELRNTLVQDFKYSKTEFTDLVENQEKELVKLVTEESKTLNDRIKMVHQMLEESSIVLGTQLEEYFNKFKERADEKVVTLLKAFDFQLEVLNKDIQRSYAEGIEQLKLVKCEFFSDLERLVKLTEIALSRQIRIAQTEAFLPRLKERKQIIEAVMHEMGQTFAEHSFSQAKAQSEGAENSLILAREQLKELVEERLARLDAVGRNQQTGLEEIFKSAADPLEQRTNTVLQRIKQAELEINECEVVCAKLAQSYNLDSDPKLAALRQEVYNKVDSLKGRLKGELESKLDEDCQKLEASTKNYHEQLNTKRAELVKQVCTASEEGLQQIRQAIHDAYNTVQTQREKYME